MRRSVDDVVALTLTATVCVVLVAVVVDLTVAAKLSEVDRAATLASLGAIGYAIARGLGQWLVGRGVGDQGDDLDDDLDDLNE